MRLIHTETLELVEFPDNSIPKYAILSHTWGDGEVSFQDWGNLEAAKGKLGFSKIDMACREALDDGLQYLWADTNCIDKRSSSELSEAINSMFSWYESATICYAYLADVEPPPCETYSDEYLEHFGRSRWFTRGWTLQELLAPSVLRFYARDWSEISRCQELTQAISLTTNIPEDYLSLRWRKALGSASIAQRMSWVSGRETTRVEDMAYCMLGIFDINMPLLYGEGFKAFTRLQEEIIRTSTDHTIFCWTWTKMVPSGWTSLLAPHPQAFKHSGGYFPVEHELFDSLAFAMTNAGLSIDLPVIQAFSYQLGILNAIDVDGGDASNKLACVPIQNWRVGGRPGIRHIMRRVSFPPRPLLMNYSWIVRQLAFYIRSSPADGAVGYSDQHEEISKDFNFGFEFRHSFLLLFKETHALFGGRGLPWETLPSRSRGKLSSIVRSRDPIGIEVFPDKKFDKEKGTVLLYSSSTTDGVLMRLRGSNKSLVIFLGAELIPGKTELRRFGGIVPHQSGTAHPQLGPVILKTALECMEARRNGVLGGWIRDTGTADSTASDVGLDFGDEVKCGDGYLFPVFITFEERSLQSDRNPNGEGKETHNGLCPEESTTEGRQSTGGMESDVDDSTRALHSC